MTRQGIFVTARTQGTLSFQPQVTQAFATIPSILKWQRCGKPSRKKGLVSKETVVLRRWGSSIQKFGFINGVDNLNWPPYRDSYSLRAGSLDRKGQRSRNRAIAVPPPLPIKWACSQAKILKADVSSVSPSSERIEELWVTCSFYSRVGATLLVVTWQREK